MTKDIAWIDAKRNSYAMEQISDGYLKNILGFISDGGGFISFLDTSKIHDLFLEAARRGLSHPYMIQEALDAYEEKMDTAYHMPAEDYYLDFEF